MGERLHRIEAEGISLTLDLEIGHIRSFEIDYEGHKITPLHSAPWLAEKDIAEDNSITPRIRYLSGDFFCAPFSENDLDDNLRHGWPANSPWDLMEEPRHENGRTIGRYQLRRQILGATLVKELTLRDGHPFVYQRHVFSGGEGRLPVSNHAMVGFAGGGRLSFSPKLFGELPASLQEPDPALGRSIFAQAVQFSDLAKLPLADGSTADLYRYPLADRHEDFAMLVEAPHGGLGWTAALRPGSGDLVLSLKNVAELPITCLWFSNGGRYYTPWNGRHLGVLGVEEGRSYANYGHGASIRPNPLSQRGIPTAIELAPDGSVAIRHVIGGVPMRKDWNAVASVTSSEGLIEVRGDDGQTERHPFDETFLG